MSQFSFNLQPARQVWSVSELTARIRELLELQFRELWVEGEISNYREAQSGHLYFTLKDEQAQVRCICFRADARLLKFRPADGLHVTVRGSVSVYDARGEYQLYVQRIEPVGLGALQLAFDQLRTRLGAEGLFDEARKKPLPVLPWRIGVVTSPDGAAVRDIHRILLRRFPKVHLILYPVRVQGEGAADEIIGAIRYFNRAQMVDVMILARGGGSLEDLWTFNDEDLARAICASAIPVITGVGHETDFTIADFVADVRAPTPSAAAEIVVRTRQEFDRHLADLNRRLSDRVRYVLLHWRHRLRELSTGEAFRRLEDLARRRRQLIDELTASLGDLLGERLETARQRFTIAHTRLDSFDLRAKLAAARARLDQRAVRLDDLLRARLDRARQRVALARARLSAADLRGRIAAVRIRAEQRWADLGARMERFLIARRRQCEAQMLQLNERSPLRLLERGYAVCYDASGGVVRNADAVSIGDEIKVRLARGQLGATVRRKQV